MRSPLAVDKARERQFLQLQCLNDIIDRRAALQRLECFCFAGTIVSDL
jgi:hypothetical protein